MARPSTTDFFDAAQWVYRDGAGLPADLNQLRTQTGHAVTSSQARHGFFGAAFETSSDQVIVAFEGTDLGGMDSHPRLVRAQLRADADIDRGENPAAYHDALRFTQRVLTIAAAQGISADNVFVAGHSLGGAEAEFVAAQTGLAGTTFGAPGIASRDIAAPGSALLDYVDYGDPVGNYSSDPNREGHVLSSDGIVRFGRAQYVGDPLSVTNLEVAGQLYGTSELGDATALGLLGQAAVDHHLLQDYAADLGLRPAGEAPGWMSTISAGQLSALAAELISGNVGSASLATTASQAPASRGLHDLAQSIEGGHLAGHVSLADPATAFSVGSASTRPEALHHA